MIAFIDPRSTNFLGGNNIQNLVIIGIGIAILIKLYK
jgi:hypothetical protein